MSARLYACISAATPGAISLKFGMGNFYENLSKYPNLVKVGQKYRALYMETRVCFIVATMHRQTGAFLNEMVSGYQDSRGGINITQTCRNVTLYVS